MSLCKHFIEFNLLLTVRASNGGSVKASLCGRSISDSLFNFQVIMNVDDVSVGINYLFPCYLI